MGLFNFLKKQFIDVIDWTEPGEGILSYRYPMQDREIQNGAQLTVRESQMALFVNEGGIADVFGPGRYQLTTQTLPILTNLKNWDKAFASPFKSDVYFFSTREQIDQRWGTPQPINIRDKEFGAIRIRANGTFSYKISDPKVFHRSISGTRELYQSHEVQEQLLSPVINSMAAFLGASEVPFLDMAANQTKFSEALCAHLQKDFSNYGLELKTFYVRSLTLPEEIQKFLDKGTSMRLLGDLQKYTQFQAAEAITLAASNEGGGSGLAAGLGSGLAVGQVISAAVQGSMGNNQKNNSSVEATSSVELLEKLHEMFKKGILTQEEFNQKKADLLKKLG